MFSGLFSGFMAPTWAEASIMALVAGVVGFFVVLRGSTFAAHAIPQGAFTGAAGAALVGANVMLGVGVFSLLGAVSIGSWARRGRHDVATALSLVGLLGTGALFLSMSNQYAGQTFGLLFGEPLGLGFDQLWPTAVLGGSCIALVLALYRRMTLTSVAPELAAARGVGPRATDMWFLVCVAAATTTALPVVGALLVFSLMTGPPAAARSLARGPGACMAFSVVLAELTAWVSVTASYWTNWPVGFFVGGLGAVMYILGRLWPASGSRRQHQAGGPGPQAAAAPGRSGTGEVGSAR